MTPAFEPLFDRRLYDIALQDARLNRNRRPEPAAFKFVREFDGEAWPTVKSALGRQIVASAQHAQRVWDVISAQYRWVEVLRILKGEVPGSCFMCLGPLQWRHDLQRPQAATWWCPECRESNYVRRGHYQAVLLTLSWSGDAWQKTEEAP